MVGKGESVEKLKRIWLIFSFTSVEKVETFFIFSLTGQRRTNPQPCYVRCTWPFTLRRSDKVVYIPKFAINNILGPYSKLYICIWYAAQY